MTTNITRHPCLVEHQYALDRSRATRGSSTLPPEVLEHIFAAASHPYYNRYETLTRCALVCKDWLPVARRLLYRDLCVDHEDLAFVLFASISSQPALGALIHVLDLSEVFTGRSAIPLSRFLDIMPNIRDLAIDLHQIRELHHHPQWRQIEHLRIFEYEDEMPLPESHMFPFQLETLTFRNENSLLNRSRDWTQVDLPNLEVLIFDSCYIGLQTATTSAILPKAPKLQDLRISRPVLWLREDDPQTDAILAKFEVLKQIIKELSSRLKYLDIDIGPYWPGHLFTADLLRTMDQLETLQYNGSVESSNADLGNTLPSGLREITIKFIGTHDTAQKLLVSLARAACLPSLIRCPSLILQRAMDHEQYFTTLLRRARVTTNVMSKRFGALSGYDQCYGSPSHGDIRLIPFSRVGHSFVSQGFQDALRQLDQETPSQ